jgi:hypothetical protein
MPPVNNMPPRQNVPPQWNNMPPQGMPPVNNMPPRQNVPPQWNNMPPQNVPPQENGGNKPAEAENKGSRDFSEMLKNRSYHEKNTDDDNGNTSGGN